GLGFSRAAPPLVVRVPPGSPAEQGGLRLGQEIVAVNGVAVRHGADIPLLVDVREGVRNTFTVRDHTGATHDLTVLPARYVRPLADHRVIEGDIGVLRFDAFPTTTQLTQRIRAALEEFERQGVRG